MLNPVILSAQIKAAMDNVSDVNIDPAVARQQLADELAAAIIAAIQSATIVYLTGLTSPAGPVVGTFAGNLT